MKKLLLFAVGTVLSGAWAEETKPVVTLDISDANSIDGVVAESFINKQGAHWSDGKPVHPGADYVVTSGQLRGCYSNGGGLANKQTFVGDSLTLGTAGSATKPQFFGWGPGGNDWKTNFRAWQCDNLHVYASEFNCNNTGYIRMLGTATFHSGAGEAVFQGTGFGANEQRGYVIDAKLISDEDYTLTCYCSAVENKDNKTSRFYFSGDMSAFKGKIKCRYSSSTLVFTSPTAFSSATSFSESRIGLERNCAMTIYPDCVQNANFGVKILSTTDGGNVYFETDAESGDIDLQLPFTATDAAMSLTFRNRGSSTGVITLRNDMSRFAGKVVVESGTLVLTDDATLPEGLRVTVREGAMIKSRRANGFKGIVLDAEAGSQVALELVYDSATSTVKTIALDAESVASLSFPLSIAFTEQIALSPEIGRLPCLTIDKAVREVTADDFVDAVPATLDGCYPRKHFEVTTDANGLQTVYLVVHAFIRRATPPVEVLYNQWVMPFATNTYIGSSSGPTLYSDYLVWEDGQALHSGAVYCQDQGRWGTWYSWDTGTADYTKADEIIFYGSCMLRSRYSIFPPSHFKGNSGFSAIGYANVARCELKGGPFYIESTGRGDPVTFSALTENDYQHHYKIDLQAPLIGTGSIKFINNTSKSGPTNECWISGDNTGWTGDMFVISSLSLTSETTNGLVLHVARPESLGGPKPTPSAVALQIQYYSFMSPDETMAFSEPTRGFFFPDNGGFRVEKDIELTVTSPIRLDGQMIKEGRGVLALGSKVDFSTTPDGTKNRLTVREGFLRGLTSTTLDRVAVTFRAGSGVAASVTPPDEVADCGLNLSVAHSVVFEGETIPVHVDAGEVQSAGLSARFPILAMKATDPDLTLKLTPERVKGYVAKVVGESATIGGTACTVYFAEYERKGLLLFVR